MKLIQNKSYGPVAELKRAFKRQIALMSLIPAILLLTNANDVYGTLTSIMFLSYVVFCLGVVIFSYYNYRIVCKMEGMDGMVKSNLDQQINILETRLKWNITGFRIALLFFIALTEIVPYFQHYGMLDLWHSFSPVVRFTGYIVLLLLQHFLIRKTNQRKFGNHIIYLKDLVKEMG